MGVPGVYPRTHLLPGQRLMWPLAAELEYKDLEPGKSSRGREPVPAEMIWIPSAAKTSSKARLRSDRCGPQARRPDRSPGRGLRQHNRGLKR
jgi:hypothetical protein